MSTRIWIQFCQCITTITEASTIAEDIETRRSGRGRYGGCRLCACRGSRSGSGCSSRI